MHDLKLTIYEKGKFRAARLVQFEKRLEPHTTLEKSRIQSAGRDVPAVELEVYELIEFH